MQERPLGVTALSLASVAVALYGLVAGIALLMGGTLGTFGGSDAGVAVLILGAIVFATGMASFFVGYGFWTQRSWAWAGGIVVYATMIVAILAMGFIGASFLSLLLPVALGAGAIWYLLRPSTRAGLAATPTTASEASTPAPTAAEPSREARGSKAEAGQGTAV